MSARNNYIEYVNHLRRLIKSQEDLLKSKERLYDLQRDQIKRFEAQAIYNNPRAAISILWDSLDKSTQINFITKRESKKIECDFILFYEVSSYNLGD